MKKMEFNVMRIGKLKNDMEYSIHFKGHELNAAEICKACAKLDGVLEENKELSTLTHDIIDIFDTFDEDELKIEYKSLTHKEKIHFEKGLLSSYSYSELIYGKPYVFTYDNKQGYSFNIKEPNEIINDKNYYIIANVQISAFMEMQRLIEREIKQDKGEKHGTKIKL